MLMDIDRLPMRGSLVMTMVMISPSRREVSPAEQLRQSPRLVPPRFPLMAAEFRPRRWLIILSHRKTSYRRRWPPEGHQGAHEAGGAPCKGGHAPHPRGRWVAPLRYFFRSIILFNSKNDFRGVSGLLELCRIGFQRLLLFQPEFQLPAFPLFMVNLVK